MFLFTAKGKSFHLAPLPDGTEIACLNRHELAYSYDEIFAESVYLKNGITLDEGACVVDVGANIGLFPLYLSQRFHDIELYAIEPVPATFNVLQENAERHFPFARCIPLALAERQRRVQLAWFPRSTGWSTRYPQLQDMRRTLRTHHALGSRPVLGRLARHAPVLFDLVTRPLFETATIEVDANTLSSLMRREGIGTIDLLKIDVEGSELGVLLGIEAEEWPRIRQVVVETTEDELPAIERILRLNGLRTTTDVSLGLRGTGFVNVYAVR